MGLRIIIGTEFNDIAHVVSALRLIADDIDKGVTSGSKFISWSLKGDGLKEFEFNTGVWRPDGTDISDTPAGHRWIDAEGGGKIQVIPFYCAAVPNNADFMFASNVKQEKGPDVLVREIHNSVLDAKYAYFKLP